MNKTDVYYNGRRVPGFIENNSYYRKYGFGISDIDIKILMKVCYTKHWRYKPILADWVDFLIMHERTLVSKQSIGPVARSVAIKIKGSVVPRK